MNDLRHMQLGQVVDFVISYNERNNVGEDGERKKKPKKRKARQADIDAFFG